MTFPFMATVEAAQLRGLSPESGPLEVVGLAPEDDCMNQMVIVAKSEGRSVHIPLSACVCREVSESTLRAVEDWQYWVARGYVF
jgi:hypothetical protein